VSIISASAHGVAEKYKGIVIRVVVIIASSPLPDVGQPLYSGSDNDVTDFADADCGPAYHHHQRRQYRTTARCSPRLILSPR